jgi:maleate isomerase
MSCFPPSSLKDLSDQVEFETGSTLTGVGIIAPFDFVLDREYWEWIPANVSLHVTRTPFLDQQVGVDMAEQLSEDEVLTAAARELTIADPAVTVFACTSGSFVHGLAGEKRCRQAILAGGARRALTTSGAMVEALTALAIRRIAVVTPYDASTTTRLIEFLDKAGFGTTSCAFLGLKGDIFRVSPGTVYRLVRAADCEDAEAIFISCTNLWTREVISALEHELGKAVLSANQVTVWAALKAVGIKVEVPGQRLFAV